MSWNVCDYFNYFCVYCIVVKKFDNIMKRKEINLYNNVYLY